MQATKFASYPLKIDRQQALRHLDYLGYKSDQAYVRFFYHSEDPRKNDDKGRKLDYLGWETAENFQRDGRGVYIVVNGAGGGHEDKDIEQCIAIFCEWDDRPIEDQIRTGVTAGWFEYSGRTAVYRSSTIVAPPCGGKKMITSPSGTKTPSTRASGVGRAGILCP